MPTSAPPIPLIVKALTGVLLGKCPTAVDLARSLGGAAVKDEMADGYRIKTGDARFEGIYVRVSVTGAHPSRETIDNVTLLLKSGQRLRLTGLSRVFGKPSHARIRTTFGPGPRNTPSRNYDESITVGFPNGPGAGYKHDPIKNPIELDLSARLMREPGPSSPDPLVTEVDIYRSDWSDIH